MLYLRFLQIQRKNFLRFGGPSVRLDTDRSVFPKRSGPLDCCSSSAVFFFQVHRIAPFLCSWPRIIPVPALRPCLTNTAFSSPLVRSATSPQTMYHSFPGLPENSFTPLRPLFPQSLRLCGSPVRRRPGGTSPVSIVSDGGYPVFKVPAEGNLSFS